jgi:hypothetical protein
MSDLPNDVLACRKIAQAARYARWRAANPNWNAKWLAANPDKAEIYRERKRLSSLALRASPEWKDHPSNIKAKAAYRKRRAEYEARQLETKPVVVRRTVEEKAKARLAWERARYQSNPFHNLNRRMSAAVRGCFRKDASKPRGSRWFDLVGYTSEQLRDHIQRQFVPKMGWHNMAEWHVDHIVPLSSFTFDTEDDPGFKAAWALTNLRPLWGTENIRKQAKREHLL